MHFDTDVLIVGAGPTGLMLACQLSRFGIGFRIIDKAAALAQESRALAIQARSMEIFQNLDLSDQFLAKVKTFPKGHIYFDKEIKFTLDLEKMKEYMADTPFPQSYLLPQSETEKILASYLEERHIPIERKTELISFMQTRGGIEAEIKNDALDQPEKLFCRYIVGCDGAKSKVRKLLHLPFEGGSYQQEFLLADATIQWKYPLDAFGVFISRKGMLVHIPLSADYSRLIMSGLNSSAEENLPPPTQQEMQAFARNVMGIELEIEKMHWSSHFHLHHRAVKQYQKGFALLAGDAAHIHSPVGGQGMNTGIQDAANLAWKLALFIKYGANKKLLETYDIERKHIGKQLLKATDRVFALMTSKNPLVVFVKQYIVPYVLQFLNRSEKVHQKIFRFTSELGIHYRENFAAVECNEGADAAFLSGPKAGARAPDGPLRGCQLFELLSKKPFNILLFGDLETSHLVAAIKRYTEVIALHHFNASDDPLLCQRYGIASTGLYFIRPDGYIGFRAYGNQIHQLLEFMARLFNMQ